jgi:aromatic ring-opening dioxygenase LigB subunit
MKKCSQCKKEKSVEEFSWKNKKKNRRSPNCKECHAHNRKQHYENNKEKIKSQVNKRKYGYRDWFKNLKSTLSCVVCGESESCCLDFHHTDPTKKEKAVSQMTSLGLSKENILKEIDKCVVVCSNCHRKIHAGLVKLE